VHPQPHYRVLLIGAAETGKSSIGLALVENAFSNEYIPTCGNILD
jgi:GTPase SAR1 family protein